MKTCFAKPVCLFVFLCITLFCFGLNYYVSADGNDSNNGLSPAEAWKTIAQLNTRINSFAPGTHIFFNRGDIFPGQINLDISGSALGWIYFEAYGTGANPVITGCEAITGWSNYSGNIWRALVNNGTVQQLLEGSIKFENARFPDTGFLRMDIAGGTTGFTDAALTQVDGYYAGCNVIMQNIDWAWEYRKVNTSTTSGVITFDATDYTTENDVGYFFNNKLEFVTAEREWYFDPVSKYLYLYAGSNPANKQISAAVYDYGIKCDWNRQYVSISNIDFTGQGQTAFWFRGAGCRNLKVKNCGFFNQDNFAMELMGDSLTVTDCSFENIGGCAIDGYTLSHFNFSNNKFSKIGLVPGMGNGGTSDFQAIRIWLGNGAIVSNNIIDSTGYNGVTINVSNAIIEKNIISNSLMTTSDGVALYAWSNNTHDNVYRQNIISHVKGNVAARPAGTYKIVNALYMDNYVYNVKLICNTIFDVDGNGIVINAGAHDNLIDSNTTYQCNAGISYSDWYPGYSVYSNRMHHNVFYANKNNSIPLLVQSNDNNYNVLAASDSNYLCNPYSSTVVRYEWSVPQSFTMQQWRNATSHDSHSTGSFYSWLLPADSSLLLVNTSDSTVCYTFSSAVDLDNLSVDSITLPPYRSQVVLLKKATVLYTFTGNGNWSDAANWINNKIPAGILSPGAEIIISPVANGECLLDVERHLPPGTKLTVGDGKKLRMQGDLIIQ